MGANYCRVDCRVCNRCSRLVYGSSWRQTPYPDARSSVRVRHQARWQFVTRSELANYADGLPALQPRLKLCCAEPQHDICSGDGRRFSRRQFYRGAAAGHSTEYHPAAVTRRHFAYFSGQSVAELGSKLNY